MQRIGLLNWNNITYDKDNTAGLLASMTAWVIEWFGTSWSWATTNVQSWKAFIECTRTNWEKVMVYFENTADVVVDFTGTKKVYIAVDQAKLDDWSNNAEDGTWVASIQTGASYPTKNFIALASITSGVIVDEREFIKFKLSKFTNLSQFYSNVQMFWLDDQYLNFWSPDPNTKQIDSYKDWDWFKRLIFNWWAITINSDWSVIIPSFAPDISWLTEKITPSWNDFFILSDSQNWWINKKIRYSNFMYSPFWDGSDWDVTITTTVTLVRDMYYNNLTITSPWVLNPNWYKVFVKWTLSGNGVIRRNWNNWSNWIYDGNGTGWAGWIALNQWTLKADIWWSNGGSWTWTGWTWTSVNPSFTTINWVAWWAGANRYWSRAGWAGWTATRGTLYNIVNTIYSTILALTNPSTLSINSVQYKWPAWSGWGGWDFTPNAWSGWGWAGWNGWVIWISAKVINFTWTMESKGWNGWIWWAWNNSFGWGGWGWQGWVIYLISSTFTSIWTQTLTGWTWWASQTWWGYTSVAWQNWNAWVTIQITI